MTRTTGLLVLFGLLGACGIGIGSDPDPHPVVRTCAPGHSRATASAPCMATMAPAIAIDGTTADWASVPQLPLTSGALAVASNADEESDLLVRAVVAGGPLDTLVLELSPSPARPASGGTDRITVDGSSVHYEKNGMVLTPSEPQLVLAWAADGDGFEALVSRRWLTYQGALRMHLIGTRGGAEVLSGGPIDVCFGFRSGDYPLPASACEVVQ